MSTIAASKISAPSFVGATASPAGIVETARHLAPKLAARAAEIYQNDRFVSANYSLLKDAGLVEAGVPRELGGGGAEIA